MKAKLQAIGRKLRSIWLRCRAACRDLMKRNSATRAYATGVAYHEASHAAIAIATGNRLIQVDSLLHSGVCTWLPLQKDAVSYAAISLAGFIGDVLFSGYPTHSVTYSDDWRTFRNACKHIQLTIEVQQSDDGSDLSTYAPIFAGADQMTQHERDVFHLLGHQVRYILTTHSDEVLALAAELDRYGTTDGKTAERFFIGGD